MKLNPDCIRDILLTVEENTSFSKDMYYKPSETVLDNIFDDFEEIETEPQINYEKLNSYTDEEILYHINQCELSAFFTDINWLAGGGCFIDDLSPAGHEFLANIRTNSNWNKVKNGCKKVGTFSLPFIKEIAIQVIKKNISDVF